MPHRDQEIAMLRKQVELLMEERNDLLNIVGAAAALVVGMDTKQLPVNVIEAADLTSLFLTRLTEETLQDALNAVKAHMDSETP